MKFINLHTHSRNKTENCLAITQYYPGDEITPGFYSLGFHPWFIREKFNETNVKQFQSQIISSDCLAIGECGLDKACETNYGLQKEVLEMQIKLAKKVNKPLLLHIVKAHQEVANMLDKQNWTNSIILHGFNQKETAVQCFKNYETYYSFGNQLFNLNSNACKTILKLPIDKIFLETDDSTIEIEKLYKQASKLLGIEIEELIIQIENNFKKVFN